MYSDATSNFNCRMRDKNTKWLRDNSQGLIRVFETKNYKHVAIINVTRGNCVDYQMVRG